MFSEKEVQENFMKDYKAVCAKYHRTLIPTLNASDQGIFPGLKLIEVDPKDLQIGITPDASAKPEPKDHLPPKKTKKEAK